jgi:hypothetical protein
MVGDTWAGMAISGGMLAVLRFRVSATSNMAHNKKNPLWVKTWKN